MSNFTFLQRKENPSGILNGLIKGRFLAKKRSNVFFYQKFASEKITEWLLKITKEL